MTGPIAVVDTNVVVGGLLTSDSNAPTAGILDQMLQSIVDLEQVEFQGALWQIRLEREIALGFEEWSHILIHPVLFAGIGNNAVILMVGCVFHAPVPEKFGPLDLPE